MADLTPRMSAAAWREMAGRAVAPAAAARKRKYRNEPVFFDGRRFDSRLELAHYQMLQLARQARDPEARVVDIALQQRFELIARQSGERAVHYVADFVVDYADGHREVHDTKSAITRSNPTYVLKRKLMLAVHGIRIREF